jgi:hypothetical protein
MAVLSLEFFLTLCQVSFWNKLSSHRKWVMGLRQSLLDVFDLKGLYDLTLELQCDNIFRCFGSKPFSLPS